MKLTKEQLFNIQHECIFPWYAKNFPKDVAAAGSIYMDATFGDLLDILEDGESEENEELLGLEDSVVRERVFEQLAKMCGCDYEDIYELWING